MDYVKKLQEGIEQLDLIKEFGGKIMKENIVPLYFTSLCRFPIYIMKLTLVGEIPYGLVVLACLSKT